MSVEKKKDYFVLLIGLLGGVRMRLMGTFYLSEIIIYVSTLFIAWYLYRRNPYVKTMIRLGGLWLVGCVVADLVNETAMNDALKGAFNIIFFLLQLPFVYWAIHDKPSRYLHYIIGCGIMSLPNYFFFGTTNEELEEEVLFIDDIWFYYSFVPIATAVLSYLYYRGRLNKQLIYGSALVFGIFMLFHNSRNIFLSMSMGVILMYYIDHCTKGLLKETVKRFRSRIVVLFVGLMAGLYLVDVIYENLAADGTLGDYAYQKYMRQKYSEEGLASARGETFMGLELISRNPILGYGSYAKDKGDKFHLEYSLKHKTEYIAPAAERYLPAHSHIVGYWLNHGILGGLFWLYVLWLMWRVIRTGSILMEPRMLLLFVLCYTNKLWDIIFSPFGNRVGMAFFLVYMAIVYQEYKKRVIPSKGQQTYGRKKALLQHRYC